MAGMAAMADLILSAGWWAMQEGGSITASYATGDADGGDGRSDRVGGLVGLQKAVRSRRATPRETPMAGMAGLVGGLVGYQNGGSITASYATGDAMAGMATRILSAGWWANPKAVRSRRATPRETPMAGMAPLIKSAGWWAINTTKVRSRRATPRETPMAEMATQDLVGGLVGDSRGSITASYATGDADGGGDTSDRVGGLVG